MWTGLGTYFIKAQSFKTPYNPSTIFVNKYVIDIIRSVFLWIEEFLLLLS